MVKKVQKGTDKQVILTYSFHVFQNLLEIFLRSRHSNERFDHDHHELFAKRLTRYLFLHHDQHLLAIFIPLSQAPLRDLLQVLSRVLGKLAFLANILVSQSVVPNLPNQAHR